MSDTVTQTKKGFEDASKAVSTFFVKFLRLKPLFDNGRGWFDKLTNGINEFTKTDKFREWSNKTVYFFKLFGAYAQSTLIIVKNTAQFIIYYFGGVFKALFKALEFLSEFVVYAFGGDEALQQLINRKNELDNEFNQKLNDPFEDIGVTGVAALIEETDAMDELGNATGDTAKAFEALKRTVSQGSGATSIFDSVLEGMNTLIGGAGTARIPEYLQGITKTMNNRIGNGDTGSPELLALQKIFDRVSGYFKDVGEISNSIGTVDVNGSTGSSQQVSMATQIVNAIQNQTETLVKSLTGIEKSIGNIAFVL